MSTLAEVGGVPLDVFLPCVMAREVRNEDWVSHGASVPLAGAALFLAMDTHAPDADVWIQGCVTPGDRNLADALIAPLRIYESTKAHLSQTQIINFSLRGQSSFQFLRPLQIDPHGNVNVSLAVREGKPDLRFHGIAIGDALNAVQRVCFYVTEHSPRVFVEQLPFRTGTGHDDGGEWRAENGLPAEAGPTTVITPMAVLDFDDSRRLQVRSVSPGVSLEEVRAATGFELGVSPGCGETPAPSAEEIAALERVDPEGIRRLEFRETRAEVLRYLATRNEDLGARAPR